MDITDKIERIYVLELGWIYGDEFIDTIHKEGGTWYIKGKQEFNGKYIIMVEYK